MPTDLWPSVRRGSRSWFEEWERAAQPAIEALDDGRDASVYLARMEELAGQPIDPIQFMAKQGPKRGRKLRARLRKAIGGASLVMILVVSLLMALVWPLIVGSACLLGQGKRAPWRESQRHPWGPARLILRLLLRPRFRRQIESRILEILYEDEPAHADSPEAQPNKA